MPTTKFASGFEVSTFEPPPPEFEPLKAHDAELVRHGFPRRPAEDPRAMQRYEAVLRRLQGKFHYIVPTFRLRDDVRHRPLERMSGTETFANWSGAVQHAPEGQAFRWVQGDWTVPNVYPPTQGEWYYCSNWIGIDGDGSGDVCQAGIECEIFQAGPFTIRNIYAWSEWFPAAEMPVTNFPVEAGDEITCVICTSGSGATEASIFLANRSSGAATSFVITAPGNTQLVGNSAEWVVERPEVNGVLAKLADYGSVFFFNADAYDGSDLLDAGNGNNIDMTEDGSMVSEGVLDTPTVVQCLYTGSQP
jgi:Peptidase A4 family